MKSIITAITIALLIPSLSYSLSTKELNSVNNEALKLFKADEIAGAIAKWKPVSDGIVEEEMKGRLPAEILNNIGYAYYKKKDYENAEKFLLASEIADASRWSVYLNLGDLYYNNVKYQFAILNYKKLLTIKPNYKKSKEIIARIKNSKERLDGLWECSNCITDPKPMNDYVDSYFKYFESDIVPWDYYLNEKGLKVTTTPEYVGNLGVYKIYEISQIPCKTIFADMADGTVRPFFHTCGDDSKEPPYSKLVQTEGINFIETITSDGRYYHHNYIYLDVTGTPSNFEPSDISDVYSKLPETEYSIYGDYMWDEGKYSGGWWDPEEHYRPTDGSIVGKFEIKFKFQNGRIVPVNTEYEFIEGSAFDPKKVKQKISTP